jgi:hypothetical protein
MNDAPSVVCFSEVDVLDDFMKEFDGIERDFVLNCLAGWPEGVIDWSIPGRARIIGARALTKNEVWITQVIRSWRALFSDADAHDAFMKEFDGAERDFILSCLAGWHETSIDWLIPGRARITGTHSPNRKEVLITEVIRFAA